MGQDKVNPSPRLLRKILGNPQSIKDWPELDSKWAGREIEMPDEAGKVNRIMPMNFLTKFMNPDAYASTSPFGTISLNRELIEKDKQDLGDVLAHEMAHVGQGKSGFLRKFYEPNKVENEAIDKEALRKVRKGNIHLRTPK